jgi:monomeric isocitrate dehydrogenase
MKTKKMISTIFTSLLIMIFCFVTNTSIAQSQKDSTKMKDWCMMKDGKLMHMQGGKMVTINKQMTMQNGTKCMANGECIMKNGEKMKMKEGECMDKDGKITVCGVMLKENENGTQ